MSKRHQSSRRKTYGRRQHEVRERHDRTPQPEAAEFELSDWGTAGQAEPFSFLDGPSSRLRYAMGD